MGRPGLALATYVGVLVVVGLITAIGIFRLLDELPTDTTELQTQLGINLGDPQVAATIADGFGSSRPRSRGPSSGRWR
jgi:hypothetical protein